jgi:hypothetical protein
MAYIKDENGNYKRTVRCGHCWEMGHNKVSCKRLRQDLRDQIADAKKRLAETSYTYERTQLGNTIARHEQKLKKLETKGTNRKCGYCSQPGHTRRTCELRKQRVAEITKETIDIRRRIAARMMEDGYAPGALVSARPHGLAESVPCIITKINFDVIKPEHKVQEKWFTPIDAIRVKLVAPAKDQWGSRMITDSMASVPFKYMNVDDLLSEQWYRADRDAPGLLSGVEADAELYERINVLDEEKVSRFVLNFIVDPK